MNYCYDPKPLVYLLVVNTAESKTNKVVCTFYGQKTLTRKLQTNIIKEKLGMLEEGIRREVCGGVCEGPP